MKYFLPTSIALLTALSLNAASTVTEKDGKVTLANDLTSVTFDGGGKSFDILSMTCNGSGNLVAPGNNRSPWTLTYLGAQGETPEVNPATAVYRGYTKERTDSSAVLKFHWDTRLQYDGNNYPVEMTVSLPDDSPLLHWDITAGLPNGWKVTEVLFPTIAVNTVPTSRVITPAGWGNVYKLRADTVYEANYPSWSASMQMMMVDTPAGAFFYSPRDPKACGKLMTIDTARGQNRFTTKTVTSAAWNSNGRFALPWTTVSAFNPDGWSAAAVAWYRPWAHTTTWGNKPLSERNIPRWLVEKDLWLRAKYTGDTTVNAVNRSIDYFGDNIAFHWYFWHNHAYDSHYPDYFPAKSEFAGIVKAVRDRNCQVMPYINGRLWDPAADSYTARDGRLASCRRADGALYTEIYPTSIVPNTVTCPSSPIWHEILCELADSIQDRLGTNGLYIDQIAAAAPYPCYAANHDHPAGGGEFWYESYCDIIDDMRANHLRDGNIIFSEENAECYIPVFDILLTVNTPHDPSCRILPLYPLIYSDRVLTTAYTYTPYTDVRNGDFRYQNMQCLLYGSQLGWVDPRLLWVDEKTEYEARFLKNLVDFRRDQHDVFIGGRYVGEFVPVGDNPMVNIPVFGPDYVVKGAEWVSPKGQRVYYVVNSDSVPHTVALPDGQVLKMEPISARRVDISE
ncbi:MAG: hypothetical protein J1E63_09110 [Muribaculaceae bacterium]|nr:hypothetical protein [Muribaculaceae bacterium]